jgi:hypothetical protein
MEGLPLKQDSNYLKLFFCYFPLEARTDYFLELTT